MKMPSSQIIKFLSCIFIAIVVFLIYFPVISFNFLNWDDNWLILENFYIQKISWENFYHIFFDFSRRTRLILGAEYLPVRDLITSLDFAIWKTSPHGFHLTNLLFYTFSCILFYLLLAKESVHPALPIIGTILFVIHPSHVEPTAWISDRKSIIAMFFMLLSLFCYIEATNTKTSKFKILPLIFSVISFIAGGFAKQFIVVFSLIIVAYETIINRKNSQISFKKKLPILGIFFLLTVTLSILHLYAGFKVGMFSPGRNANAFSLPFILFFDFFRLFLFPCYGGGCYSGGVFIPFSMEFSHLKFFEGIILFCGLTAFAFYFRKRLRFLSFSIVWFIVTLLPFLQIVPVQNLLTWRYIFPATASCGWAVLQINNIIPTQKLSIKLLITFVLVIFSTILISVTTNLLPIWRNNETFWMSAIEENPLNFIAYQNLSKHYSESGEKEKSLEVATKMIKTFPKNPQAHFILAMRLYENGKTLEAEEEMKTAINLNPNYKEAWNNMGFYELEKGNHDKALKCFDRALEIDPDYAIALNNKGRLYLKTLDIDTAVEYFKKALQKDPYLSSALYNLAIVELQRGHKISAINKLEKLLSINPLYTPAVQTLKMLKKED